MIRSLISVDGGSPIDTYKAFGFIYIDADERIAADEKDDASTSYAEEAGEHRDGRTVDAPFDYTVKFLIEAPNKDLTNVNRRVANFNKAVRETISGSDVKRRKEIAFFNLLNRVKIVGYPDVIATPTKVYRSNRYGELDFAEIELRIRVSDPRKCDFQLNTENL